MIIESVAVADALLMFIVGNLGRVAFDEERFGLMHYHWGLYPSSFRYWVLVSIATASSTLAVTATT
jgi:hypothetical protein